MAAGRARRAARAMRREFMMVVVDQWMCTCFKDRDVLRGSVGDPKTGASKFRLYHVFGR